MYVRRCKGLAFRHTRCWGEGIKTLTFTLIGALLGIVIASLVVPPALSWYTAPGGLPQGTQIQALVQIPEVIAYATGRLMHYQLIGAGVGSALGLIAGLFFSYRSRPRSVIATPATRPTTA